MRRARLLGIIATLLMAVAAPAWAERAPDLVLTGEVTHADHQTWREVPFRVPAGVERLTLSFEHDGAAQKSVIDLGLADPQRFRGWSGGNKSQVVLAAAEATPSYLPGPVVPGRWRLLLGVPNLRPGAVAHYTARIWFDRAGEIALGAPPVRAGPGWYRGDLHLHTAHSDGSCKSKRGRAAPCPVFLTLEAARARGLDFVAITDHNTVSQAESLRELAPYYDDLLILAGRELTTFQGHANIIGTLADFEFRLGSKAAPDLGRLLARVPEEAIVSINHPGAPSGELCMGCGWTAPIDPRIAAVEVVNGANLALTHSPEGALSGLPFWTARLDAGARLTGLGGSDNHDPTAGGLRSVGAPATVVHARELSAAAVLEAIRAGHVFVDVWGSPDGLLEVTARAGEARAEMGDVLPAAAGQAVEVEAHVAGAPAGARLVASGPGAELLAQREVAVVAGESRTAFSFTANGTSRWLRLDLRGADGRLLLIGNPVYLRP